VVRKALTLLCLAIPVLAQHLTIGAEGGLRLTGDSPDYGPPGYAGYSGSSDSKPYLVGPKIEVGLPLHFALEADVLYSRLGNTLNFWLIGESWVSRTIA